MSDNPYLAHHVSGPSYLSKRHRPTMRRQTIAKEVVEEIIPKPPLAYGNYPAYYGYRQSNEQRLDARLYHFKKEWFTNKRIIDVGCNAGWLTIEIGMLFRPIHIEGVDIDPSLIRKARKHQSRKASLIKERDLEYFPVSCVESFGFIPFIHPNQEEGLLPQFPHNVSFRAGDWALESLPSTEQGKVDVILALSITKWIHLNSGDNGLKKFFRKCYHCLLDGGMLILEPQPLESYQKRASTAEMQKHFSEIKLTPDLFSKYLIGPEIGFSRCQVLGNSTNESKGFQRPLYLFVK